MYRILLIEFCLCVHDVCTRFYLCVGDFANRIFLVRCVCAILFVESFYIHLRFCYCFACGCVCEFFDTILLVCALFCLCVRDFTCECEILLVSVSVCVRDYYACV